MTQKPKIQYVGMFYVHGSEARKLQEEERRKKAKTRLPLARLRQIEEIYIDPVAIVGVVVALIMLVTLVVGAVQITKDWAEYQQMSEYVSDLNLENARLTRKYRTSVNLDDIRVKAEALGMVPVEEVPVRTVAVSVPEIQPEPTAFQRLGEFLTGLFA